MPIDDCDPLRREGAGPNATALQEELQTLRTANITLTESRERLERVLEGSDQGFWEWNLASNTFWASERYESMLGFAMGERNLAPENWPKLVHPDDMGKALASIEQHKSGQTICHEVEIRCLTKSGDWKWILTRGRIVKRAIDGTPLMMSGTHTDISARKAQEEELEQQKLSQRALLDNLPLLAWLKDEQCRFLTVNTPFAAAFGWPSPDALVGRDDFDIVPKDLAESYRADDRNVLETGESQCVEEYIEVDGHRRWIETYKSPVFLHGRIIGTVGAAQDISERRELLDKIREHEQRLSLFIEGAPVGIAMFDQDMRYIAVSRRFLEDYGISAPDIIGCCHYDLLPNIPERWRAIHQACLAGESHHCDEDPLTQRDGSVIWSRWSIRPWWIGSGKVGGILLFTEDITERKHSEAALLAAKRDAEQANISKSRFLAAASHDLRQPLSALSIYVKIIAAKASASDASILENMGDCVSSLRELLTDLLDLSKLDAAVISPTVSTFGIPALLDNVISIHAPVAAQKGLYLRCRVRSLTSQTDPVLFRRIINNLIANAIRYTEQGGIVVACRKHEGKMWVEVWDSGVGIPSDKTEEIFEEFRQLGNDARNRGSGLGLAIVAQTAALLGLSIRVRSRLGKGSVFAIELPLGGEIPEAQTIQPVVRSLRVALVDDNSAVLTAMTMAMELMGHQVIGAQTGSALLHRLGDLPPDIVVSDYRLDFGKTGVDVIAAVRKQFGEALPALLVTGDTDPALLRNLANDGIVVLHKPVDVDALHIQMAQLTQSP